MPRLQARAQGLQEKFKVETHIIQADLSTEAGCAAVEQYIANNQVDVLINNAGFGLKKLSQCQIFKPSSRCLMF